MARSARHKAMAEPGSSMDTAGRRIFATSSGEIVCRDFGCVVRESATRQMLGSWIVGCGRWEDKASAFGPLSPSFQEGLETLGLILASVMYMEREMVNATPSTRCGVWQAESRKKLKWIHTAGRVLSRRARCGIRRVGCIVGLVLGRLTVVMLAVKDTVSKSVGGV